MCAAVIRDSLRKSDVQPEQVGAVVIEAGNWHCALEDRIQILEGLHENGIARVPVIGLEGMFPSATQRSTALRFLISLAVTVLIITFAEDRHVDQVLTNATLNRPWGSD